MLKILYNTTEIGPLIGQLPICLVRFPFAGKVQPLYNFLSCFLLLQTQVIKALCQ